MSQRPAGRGLELGRLVLRDRVVDVVDCHGVFAIVAKQRFRAGHLATLRFDFRTGCRSRVAGVEAQLVAAVAPVRLYDGVL